MTTHRRENFGERLQSILLSVKKLAQEFLDHQFVFPVHPNPNVQSKVFDYLKGLSNVILTSPLDYPETICLIKCAKLILTDSGGIQEEAPAFGNPVLVMRYETERTEGIEAGFAKLVGTEPDRILKEAHKILRLDKDKTRLDSSRNPYGDGYAALKIHSIIKNFKGRK
ncbi:UDP-N-acetylglucosamine 2-epimerase [Helicobacter turcicus]|uniref:UDP-N-acetylglucosamine 2-epimerase n=1 Tax=Helicobacter turcicus TaxID=2867412 RepID=UPI003211B8DD